MPGITKPSRVHTVTYNYNGNGQANGSATATYTFNGYYDATHSSVLAWRIPGTGEPGGLPSMGSHGVGYA